MRKMYFKLLSKLIALSALLSLIACAPFNYTQSDAPIPLKTIAPISPAPKIAIVLGSGGPRGYAHIGVIRVLEEVGIRPDLIVGSSVGALIGAFWASGMPTAEIDRIAFEGGPLTLFDLNPFADRGWIRGEKLQNYVSSQLKAQQLEQLKTKIIVVATERSSKQARFFMQGNAAVAVRASSAVRDIISPVGIAGIEYEDGDESLPVAVSAARQAGAQFVIAVDVSAHESATPANVDPAMKARDLTRRKRITPEISQADFLIHPDLGYYASPRSAYFESCRQIGEQHARQIMPELLKKLQAKGLL